MTHPERIIILHHTAFSDKSVVLHTLSQTYGRRSFMVRNATRCMNFFQPLNILECNVSDSGKGQLLQASAFSEYRPLLGLRGSMGKNAISMFMAEVLYRSLREGALEPGLFEWCESQIMLLDALQASYANFHIRFLLDYAGAIGFAPHYEALLPFMGESISGMEEFLHSDFTEAMLIPMHGAQRTDLCNGLLKYLEFHMEVPIRVRSLSVLGELFI